VPRRNASEKQLSPMRERDFSVGSSGVRSAFSSPQRSREASVKSQARASHAHAGREAGVSPLSPGRSPFSSLHYHEHECAMEF